MRADWVECKLIDLSTKITDGTHHKPNYTKEGIHFISVKDIKNDIIDFSDTKFISKEDHEILFQRCNPEFDDLLITKSGTIGRMAIVPKNPIFSLFVSVALIKNKKEYIKTKFLKLYLEYYLKSFSLDQVIKGGVLKNYHLEDLRLASILLPPIPEQRAIVKKIEALFSSLDAGIADLKKAQDQLKIYRQAVLKKAFEGDNEGGTQIEVNKITASLASNRYLHKLGSVISLQGGYAFKSAEFTPTGIPIVKIANVNLDNINWDEISYVSDDRLEEFKNYSLSEGDVLIAMTRPVIKSLNTVKTVIVKKGDLPCLLNQRVGRFLIKDNKVSKEYLQYFIKSTFFKDPIVREANDSLLPNISGKTIENFDIILPKTLEEQAQIVKEIEARLSVCDAVEQQIKDSLTQAEALRQSILKKAFEGRLLSEAEVTACQQEPDYEPASVLLERIKAEKEAKKPVKKTKKK